MRIGVDATPLLGSLTGVGTYTANLLSALRAGYPADELVATAFSARGLHELTGVVPDGVAVHSRAVPARLLRASWGHAEWPPVEVLTGPVDVFHATNFVLPPSRRAAGVLTVHDLAYLRHPETVAPASLAYRELVPLGIARAEAVVTPSRAVADQVLDAYRISPDRVHVTHLGVDPAWARTPPPDSTWLQRRGIPPQYLLAVGTLEPRKNLHALVEAYVRLVGDDAEVPPLVLAGMTGWGQALDLSHLPAGRIVLTGHLAYDDLRRVVAGASLLAFPSLDEGFGLPPLEALACGVSVLANDLPVTREVLGDQARFCDARSAEALAEGLRCALADPVGDPASRRRRAAEFTWERTAAQTREIYAEVSTTGPSSS